MNELSGIVRPAALQLIGVERDALLDIISLLSTITEVKFNAKGVCTILGANALLTPQASKTGAGWPRRFVWNLSQASIFDRTAQASSNVACKQPTITKHCFTSTCKGTRVAMF